MPTVGHTRTTQTSPSDRIDGSYKLVEMPVSAIPESEWEIWQDKVDEYASRPTPFPPVVLDNNLSFIDGGHRHAAAIDRGDKTIMAFLPTRRKTKAAS